MLIDRPDGDEGLEYLPWWQWTVENLELLLEPRHRLLSSEGQRTGLAKLLCQAREAYFDGDGAGVVDLAHLVSLVEDLDYLRKTNPQLFTEYKKKLTSGMAKEFGFLTGNWFEIRVARMLIRSGLQFTQPNPPDFNVNIEGIDVGVECYAPRVTVGQDVRRRVVKAVRNKESKYKGQPWILGPTVLVLDGTWLARADGRETVQGQDALSEDFTNGLVEAATSTDYDLIIAFWFGHATSKQKDLKTTSCVSIPADIQNLTIATFRDRLLKDFGPEDDVVIRLPDLPTDRAAP